MRFSILLFLIIGKGTKAPFPRDAVENYYERFYSIFPNEQNGASFLLISHSDLLPYILRSR